jgi:hypothetical protein
MSFTPVPIAVWNFIRANAEKIIILFLLKHCVFFSSIRMDFWHLTDFSLEIAAERNLNSSGAPSRTFHSWLRLDRRARVFHYDGNTVAKI